MSVRFFWLILISLISQPSLARQNTGELFFADVIQVSNDQKWPTQEFRINFRMPCNTLIDRYIQQEWTDPSTLKKTIILGVQLIKVEDDTCKTADPQNSFWYTFHVGNDTRAKITVLGLH